ncbi:MAG: PTS sugar transporter subunit IIB [Gemmatimonadales bacterium]|jgi:mannose/fructose/N-acetylgalactosamine-specific phosphotransferase system component IIB
MPIALFRVDDRLVHGQVVIGWGRPLGLGFVVVVDPALAASEWEQELYRMGVPAEIDLEFCDVAEAVRRAPEWARRGGAGILLTGDIATMRALREAGFAIPKVNLGGIHSGPGRSERLPYLFLNAADLADLRRLEALGVTVAAQDVPTAPAIALGSLA